MTTPIDPHEPTAPSDLASDVTGQERRSLTHLQGGSPMMVRVVDFVADRWSGAADFADLVAALYARFARHRGPILAAGFAYYTLLAIVPTAIALGSIAALVGDPAAVREALDRAVDRAPGLQDTTTALLDSLIAVVDQTSSTAFGITTIVGTLLAIYASSKVFVTGSQIVDLAFQRPHRHEGWIVNLVAAVIVLALLISLVLVVVVLQTLPIIQDALGVAQRMGGLSSVLIGLAWVAVVYLSFAATFRYGAPRAARVRFFSHGAWLATLITMLGTVGTIIYINLSGNIGAAIAVLGGAIVVQLLLYVIGMALVAGAELEAVRSSAHADVPDED